MPELTLNEVLRRMLDERGVEYVVDEEYGEKYPPEQRVTWSCDIAGEDMTVTAQDYCISINDDGSADYCLDLEFHEVFTPEQAIAATLGAAYEPPVAAHWDGDTLTLTIPRDPSCIRVQRSAEQPCKVYADESKVIAATLGATDANPTQAESSGTCRDTGTFNSWGLFTCSNCSIVFPLDAVKDAPSIGRTLLPNYCPNCGRKVVDE